MKRIAEFEALRGLLALWVVVGHVIKHSGYTESGLGPLRLLAESGFAVDIFIILSGFVIFSLLDGTPMGYGAFIARRFFRLFPLYVVVLIVSAATLAGQEQWTADFPWQTPFLEGSLGIVRASRAWLTEQFAVHLTMLHGLLPDALLPHSQYAIIGQAWSISVEWQFYLLAPLLFAIVARAPYTLAGVVLAVIFLKNRYWLGEGFAVNQAGFFAVGILSYFLCKLALRITLDRRVIGIGVVTVSALLGLFVTRPVSLLMWTLILGLVLAARGAPSGFPALVSALSRTGVPQWLGRISYSIYLNHFLVLYLASSVVLALLPGISQAGHLALVMPLTMAGTLALSSLTFRWIEAPFMALGHRLTSRQAAVQPAPSC